MSEIGGEIGKDRILGGLLKTGQTIQYDGYEDDGYFEKGLSKRYTILTAGQYAGTTDIILNAKTDVHSNNCVYDQRTKLMWSRYVAGSVGPGSDGKLPWTTAGGDGIFPYVAAANLANLGGYSDWRIPNILELKSIMGWAGGVGGGVPDPTAFPTWPAGEFFTSTTAFYDAGSVYEVGFNSDHESWIGKTSTRRVALVRGG